MHHLGADVGLHVMQLAHILIGTKKRRRSRRQQGLPPMGEADAIEELEELGESDGGVDGDATPTVSQRRRRRTALDIITDDADRRGTYDRDQSLRILAHWYASKGDLENLLDLRRKQAVFGRNIVDMNDIMNAISNVHWQDVGDADGILVDALEDLDAGEWEMVRNGLRAVLENLFQRGKFAKLVDVRYAWGATDLWPASVFGPGNERMMEWWESMEGDPRRVNIYDSIFNDNPVEGISPDAYDHMMGALYDPNDPIDYDFRLTNYDLYRYIITRVVGLTVGGLFAGPPRRLYQDDKNVKRLVEIRKRAVSDAMFGDRYRRLIAEMRRRLGDYEESSAKILAVIRKIVTSEPMDSYRTKARQIWDIATYLRSHAGRRAIKASLKRGQDTHESAGHDELAREYRLIVRAFEAKEAAER